MLLVVNEHLPVRSGGNNQDFYFENPLGAGFQTCAWALLIKDTDEELIQPNYS
jgi:hypothetical protein